MVTPMSRKSRFIGRERRQDVVEHIAVLWHGDLRPGGVGQEFRSGRIPPAARACGEQIEIPAAHRIPHSSDGHHLVPDVVLGLQESQYALLVVDRHVQQPLRHIFDQLVRPGELDVHQPVTVPCQQLLEAAAEE